MKKYDYTVVGNGLIGAAFALELSQLGADVLLIGAPFGHNNSFYASHNDDSRLVKMAHSDPFWQDLAKLNLRLMQSLVNDNASNNSSTEFFRQTPVYLFDKDTTPLNFNGDNKLVQAESTAKQDNFGGILNPLAYIESMNRKAKSLGMKQIADVVSSLMPGQLILQSGQSIWTNKIVDCRGLYSDSTDFKRVAKILMYLRVPVADLPDTCCFVDSGIDEALFNDAYGFVNYRKDGDFAQCKLGVSENAPRYLDSHEAVDYWFARGFHDYHYYLAMEALAKRYFPTAQSIDIKPCAFTTTVTGRPVVTSNDNILTITGCNGLAAKCPQALAQTVLAQTLLLKTL